MDNCSQLQTRARHMYAVAETILLIDQRPSSKQQYHFLDFSILVIQQRRQPRRYIATSMKADRLYPRLILAAS